MKIAFCISGHLRNYLRLKDNFYEFKNFIKQYGDVDTFVTTYNNRNAPNSWSVQHGLNEENSHNDTITIDMVKDHYDTQNVEILNYYFYDSNFSPLKYTNITDKIYNWKPRPDVGNASYAIHNDVLISTRMFYLIYRANIQKLESEFKNNSEYDIVFRMRPDMQYFPQIYTNQLRLNLIDLNKIYIPDGHIWTDQFGYGSSLLMNKYANTYLRVSSIHDKEIFGDPETVMNECLLDFIGPSNIVRVPKCGYLLAENPNSHITYR
jgi:hypothetical protein